MLMAANGVGRCLAAHPVGPNGTRAAYASISRAKLQFLNNVFLESDLHLHNM